MPETILLEAEEKMEGAIESLLKQFSRVSTGRANPAILDSVRVDYYGIATPLSQCCALSVPEPQQIMIKPFDATILKDVERAINDSNLGLNTNNDGKCIRIHIPPLTEDRRKQFAKDVSKMSEECKVKVRNIRRDANDAIKKLEISEDETNGYLDEVQSLTDKYVANVEQCYKSKEKDLMTV